MKIGAILPHIKKFGGVRRYLEFGKGLVRQGHTYNLYVKDLSDQEWIKELKFTGNILHIRELASYELDACICGDAGCLHHLNDVNAKLKIVNVIFPPFSNYLLGSYNKFLHRDDLIIVGNSSGWNGPLKWRDNYYTIPGAVNLEMFQPKPTSERKNFKILFFAKSRPWKGLDTILLAYDTVRNTPGVEWGYFDSEIHTDLPPEIRPHINLPQSSMADLYSSYDLFISAEKLAGWQNTTAEAMACGVPVITTAIGTKDFAQHNRTALVIPEAKPSAIVKAITLFRKSTNLRKAIGKAGRAKIQQFSWTIYTAKWVEFMKNQLNSKVTIISEHEAPRQVTVETKPKPETKPVIEPEPKLTINVKDVEKSALRVNKAVEKLKEKNITIENVSDAVNSKAEELKKHLGIQNEGKKVKTEKSESKLFDKYEKFGAYHWNSKDPVYDNYVKKLIRICTGVKNLYGTIPITDIGGGDGYIAKNLALTGFPVTIVDTNDKAISLCQTKLKSEIDTGKISLMKEDFFTLPKLGNFVLLSQVIEHFYEPKKVVDKLRVHMPDIILITTPIKKEDGTLWDPQYHVKEFSPEELIDLFSPMIDLYSFEMVVDKPYNQYLVLQKKKSALENYFKALNLYINTVVTIDGEDTEAKVKCSKKVINRMIDAVTKMTSNKVQMGDIDQ